MAVIGIAIQALVVSTLLPVTSHAIARRQFAAALGQLASVAEETVADLLPEEEERSRSGSGGGTGSGSNSSSGSSGSSPRGLAPAPPPQLAGQHGTGSHPGSPPAADGTQVPPSAFQLPAQQGPPGPASSPATPPATPPGTPPVGPGTSRRRRALEQQSSLIALPPEPASLGGGGGRRAAAHALRQLREPVGPALIQEAEPLLGAVYSRLLRRAWQAGFLLSKGTTRLAHQPLSRCLCFTDPCTPAAQARPSRLPAL